MVGLVDGAALAELPQVMEAVDREFAGRTGIIGGERGGREQKMISWNAIGFFIV
jgi:hypothetical protein